LSYTRAALTLATSWQRSTKKRVGFPLPPEFALDNCNFVLRCSEKLLALRLLA